MPKTVDECKGCIYEGKLVYCAVPELRWAWYDLLKTIPFVERLAVEPEPCYMREEMPDEKA